MQRYPGWQWLSLELPTEDAVPQTKRARYSMQRMEHKQKFKKTKEKCCQTAFCYPKLTNSGFKDSFGIKSKEEKKNKQIRSLLISHFGISLNPKNLLDFNQ